MRQERTDGLLVSRPRRIAESFDRLFNFFERLVPRGLIFFGLLGIEDQDEPAAPLPLADDNLFDLKMVSYSLVSALERKRFLMRRLAVPQLLAQDVMPASSL